uniref:Spermidine/putrescine transport system ATP-binding protein n=1 Tax=Candidatus Kentrum sp. LPFa TaxID=2126335 RepID=A0A450XYE9_9GAMM|nr:MAG: spermidine/putrescine transport system ATP-binding protein [Candidatus Kentron sp. LPFa]VFK34285.1 MAG: spermidine/putrescine transport system ATP-binding protein [Candidatus Kentron sp. LPFa]
MTDFAISLKDISHSAAGGRGIINDLNLDISDGEVFAIIGPSGCGKTTTLKLISGLERPSTGDVSVFGYSAHAYKPHERCVATVFQSRALFPGMSVRANIEFGLKVKKYPKGERAGKIRAISEKFHLDGLLDRDVGKLSGGEQQRVALARSLVVEPKILLLDEPYTGLDQMLRNQLQRDLKTLMDERSRTYVLVSHDFDNVLALADRVAVMKSGKIVQLGAPSDILENPKSSFIVNLLGWSNLIHGAVLEIQDDDRRIRVQTGAGAWWGRNQGNRIIIC